MLGDVVVRHRDDEGAIRFAVERDGEVLAAVWYGRRGPTESDLRDMAVDFTADEPWDWEDRDFGRFVFAVATGTGPIKFRHALEHDARPPESYGTLPRIDELGVRRGRSWGLSRQEVDWDDLVEVRLKFEIGSIWAEHSLAVLHGREGLCTVNLPGADDEVVLRLHEHLRRLPGWDDAAEAAFADAVDYAERFRRGECSEDFWERCERPLWHRSAS